MSVMNEKCPVCETECENEATVCSVCGFTEDLGINRTWLNPEDVNYWFKTKVEPHRVRWEAQKREAELLTQVEETQKQVVELLAQVDNAKKQNVEQAKNIEVKRDIPRKGELRES